MTEKEILSALENLAQSQGKYARFVKQLNELDDAQYRIVMNELVTQHFNDVVDLVMYLES